MIKITNGEEVLLVTSGAFKTQFKPHGWRAVEDKPKNIKPQQVKVEDDDEPVVEKPLSEMTGKELKAKAKELGVDISAATNKAEARKMLADATR